MADSNFRLEDHFDKMTIAYIRRAHGHDIEYKYSAVWQRILGNMFTDPWQFVCEQAPHDDSRRRMDYKVELFDEAEGTISPVIFIEAKRPGSSVKDVERQGLAIAKSAISKDKMTGIYVLTLWGLKFRAWYLSLEGASLEPLFGSAVSYDKESYLELTTRDGLYEFEKSVAHIKENPPLRSAPVLPSQQAQMLQMLQSGTYYQDEAPATGEPWGQQQWNNSMPITGNPGWQNIPSSAQESNMASRMQGQNALDAEAMLVDENPQTKDKGKGKKDRVEVRLKLETHKFSKDEYVFSGLDGDKRTTFLSDWKKHKDHNGQTVYEYQSKRAVYWCWRLPEA